MSTFIKHMASACALLSCFLAAPTRVSAETEIAPWIEMARACEDVMLLQSFSPLAKYADAPYSYGKPGLKALAVYSEDQELVVIAQEIAGSWQKCEVRETEESRARWREQGEHWNATVATAFVDPGHVLVSWKFDPNRPFSGVLRCDGNDPLLLVIPYLHDFSFRVKMGTNLSASAKDRCWDANS